MFKSFCGRPMLAVLAMLVGFVALAGCASRPEAPVVRDRDEQVEKCGVCGRVRFVQQVVQQVGPGEPGANGGLLGGVVGGVAGAPRVGGGSGQVLDRLTIDMDFGGSQIVELLAPSGVRRRGDRVEVRGNFVTVIRDEF